MPHLPEITDSKIAKAYAHPLRIEIMGLLDDRVASPRQLSEELGASLATTSYHVRQLLSMNLIKLVRRRPTRGSIEHFYTALAGSNLTSKRMTVTRAGWDELSALFGEVQERLAEISEREAARLEGEPDAGRVETTAVIMLFESRLAEMGEDGDAAALTAGASQA